MARCQDPCFMNRPRLLPQFRQSSGWSGRPRRRTIEGASTTTSIASLWSNTTPARSCLFVGRRASSMRSVPGRQRGADGSPRQTSGAWGWALFVVNERPAAAVTRRAEAQAEDPRQRVDGGGRLCAAGRRGPPGAHAPAGERRGDGRIDGGSEAARRRAESPSGGRGGEAPRQPNVRTLGRLAMTPNGCREPASVSPDLPPVSLSPPPGSSSSPAWIFSCSDALVSMSFRARRLSCA